MKVNNLNIISIYISNMNTSDKSNPKKIIGIQFSILSPEEIKKASTVEITNRDT